MSSPAFERPDAIILSHQRSGTHFLQASLASHPGVHGRGECVLRYERLFGDNPSGREAGPEHTYLFGNFPGRLNLAIVMYSQVPRYEELCGSISNIKIIHLLRNPEDVALSIARKAEAKKRLGEDFRAHYTLDEEPVPAPLDDRSELPAIVARVKALQETYLNKLSAHRDILVVSYEDLTRNQQVNEIDPGISKRLLDFLGLPNAPLTNRLRKTPPL